MTDPQFDVIGIGNAIVDVLAHADDEFLAAEGLTPAALMRSSTPAVMSPAGVGRWRVMRAWPDGSWTGAFGWSSSDGPATGAKTR